MKFFVKRLNFGNLRNSFKRTRTRDTACETKAQPAEVELKISVTSATLSLLDGIKIKAAEPSRSATIDRLIRSHARIDAEVKADKLSGTSRAKGDGQPMASAIVYYQTDGTSRRLEVTVRKDNATFRLTLHYGNHEFGERSFSFANYTELAHALDNAKDPRIGSQEARLLLDIISLSE